MAARALPVGIHPRGTPAQLADRVRDAQPQVLLLENEALLPLPVEVRARLGGLRQVILFDSSAARSTDAISFVEVLSQGLKESDVGYWERVNAVQPDEVAGLVLTSGTVAAP